MVVFVMGIFVGFDINFRLKSYLNLEVFRIHFVRLFLCKTLAQENSQLFWKQWSCVYQYFPPLKLSYFYVYCISLWFTHSKTI